MGTPYTFDEGMSCHSPRIELFYFDDNFRPIAQWVPPLTRSVAWYRCQVVTAYCQYSAKTDCISHPRIDEGRPTTVSGNKGVNMQMGTGLLLGLCVCQCVFGTCSW